MTDLLGKSETKHIEKPNTKHLENKDTKKLEMSETRAKKIKHSYNVKDAENALLLKTKNGDIVIEMFPNDAPKHVARIKELVRDEADLEEIIGAAYGMIIEEGGDPGIVLAGLGITD